jgi:hypothetical protein
MGWTMSASELWVAVQRAMPDWARGRMNATVIIDLAGGDGAWGSDLGFVWRDSRSELHFVWSRGSLPHKPVSGRRLSINFARNLEDGISRHSGRVASQLSFRAKLIKLTPLAPTGELIAA